VFLNSHRRKTPENAITQKKEFVVETFEKVFDMDFLQKYLYGVFELSLPRKTQRRTLKKNQEKDVGWWVGGFEIYKGRRRRKKKRRTYLPTFFEVF
jgi:hypothetical protein